MFSLILKKHFLFCIRKAKNATIKPSTYWPIIVERSVKYRRQLWLWLVDVLTALWLHKW